MATLALPRGLDGRLILPGRITKRVTADFMWDTTLPPWLTVTAGTAAFAGVDTSNGRVSVATDATSGAAATIRTTNSIDLTAVESVCWEIEGFVSNDTGTGINFTAGLASATAGVVFAQTGNATTGVTANGATAGTAALTSNANVINLGEGNRNKNIAFLYLPRYKHAYYLESDQVGADWDLTASGLVTNGAVTPSVGITTRSATARTFRAARIALTVTVN